MASKNSIEETVQGVSPETDKTINTTEQIARRNSTHIVTKQDVDDSTVFYNQHKDSVFPLDEAGVKRLNRKNFWFLLTQTWWIAFLIHLDKSTLSQASTMGLFKDVNITKNQYNDLFVLFYVGYLIALWPGAALAQHIGHKYFITGSLFLWALLLGMHPLVKTGGQMMALRFLLGMVSETFPGVPDHPRNIQETTSTRRATRAWNGLEAWRWLVIQFERIGEGCYHSWSRSLSLHFHARRSL